VICSIQLVRCCCLNDSVLLQYDFYKGYIVLQLINIMTFWKFGTPLLLLIICFWFIQGLQGFKLTNPGYDILYIASPNMGIALLFSWFQFVDSSNVEVWNWIWRNWWLTIHIDHIGLALCRHPSRILNHAGQKMLPDLLSIFP